MTIKTLYPTVRPTLNLDFAKTKVLDPRITFTRIMTGASVATYVGADGLIKTAGNNVPRFDHNPTTGESLGLLVEEARTNIIVSSSVFSTGGWNQNGIVLTANAGVAPDGTTTATSVLQGTGNNRSYHFDNTGAGNKTLTIFAKSNAGSSITLSGSLTFGTNSTGSVILNTANGTISTALGCSSVAFPNGWYRFIIPIYIGAGTGNTNYLELNGPVSSVFVWGVQIEAAAFPTSYIPTTSATVTRAADVASMTGTNFSSWYRQDEGTLYVKVSNKDSTGRYIASINDSSTLNQSLTIYQLNSTQTALFSRTSSGVQANIFVTGAINASNKVAGSYKINDFAVSVNSGTIGTDTSGAIPISTTLDIGAQRLSAGDGMSGTIARLAFYPVRLPDAQLQALTAT
jgi:hypothetical protein